MNEGFAQSSEQLELGWPVHGVQNVPGSPKANLRGMICGQVNAGSVAKANNPPIKQFKFMPSFHTKQYPKKGPGD
jgi:hypothetical protein